MSEGGPPEIAVAAFRDVKLIFSASNSIGPEKITFLILKELSCRCLLNYIFHKHNLPGFTSPVYF